MSAPPREQRQQSALQVARLPTPAVGPEGARQRRPLDYKWIVLINTTIGVLMSSLDNSIITIALPDILKSLQASVVEVMWVVMGYSLIITALLLPFARFADMKGRVKMYNLGFIVFTLASALCGFSQTGGQLVIFRLVQGVGAAMLFANSTALVTDAFPDEQRGFALGVNMMAAVSGFVAGTVLGGVITQFWGWRFIFFINVPVGIFATLWAFFKLHDVFEAEHEARFDLGGIVTFPLAVSALLAALTYVVLGRWGSSTTNLLFALGVVMLAVFLVLELRTREPMMDLALFRIRIFWAGQTSLFLNALARGGVMFIMTWYFQSVLDDSPLTAGLKMLPLAVMMMLSAPIAGRLSDLFGSRWLSTFGLVMTTAALAWMSTFAVNVPYV
ncbi:MAG: MFS transporter, partial [Chloroflexota bacterium]